MLNLTVRNGIDGHIGVLHATQQIFDVLILRNVHHVPVFSEWVTTSLRGIFDAIGVHKVD